MMTDQVLVSRVLEGDGSAFKKLIQQHQRLVSFMVGKLVRNMEEHEEICQDVFIKVYEKLGDFNFESKLSTWIGTIAYRHAINSVRKSKQIMVSLPEEAASPHFADHNSPESIVSDQDTERLIGDLIERLPPQYRIVITLYHVEGMHYDEIANITGMPEGTVKNYLFRARTLLKEKLKIYLP
jgi:RNA polymerase sigma factor (sigma-70 family)